MANDCGLKTVVERYKQMVFGVAMTRLRNKADAEDVFSEVFLLYFEKGKSYRDEEHRKAWLLRVTMNICAKTASKRSRTFPINEALDIGVSFDTDEQQDLYDALLALPEADRTALHLFYFEDMTTQEVAHALGIRPGAARMRLSRGRERLRELLEDSTAKSYERTAF